MDLHDKSFHFSAKRIEALQRLHIYDSDDLLSYYPYRFDTISSSPISEWKIKEKVTFEAEVISRAITFRNGRFASTKFEVMHEDTVLKITIFNRPWASKLAMNSRITITGIYMGNHKVTVMNYDTKPLHDHEAVTPVYSSKEGIQQRTIRASIKTVYEVLQNEIIDYVPEEMIRKYHLLRRSEAYRKIHFPESLEDTKQAFRTLKYEEFLRFFIAMELNKDEEGLLSYKQPKNIDITKVKTMISCLPFSLTKDQVDTLNAIINDMRSNVPMYRLVQGDVGCGKTVVAAFSMYACFLSGYQSALLAPTEILAKQHLASLKSMIKDPSISIEVLYSAMNTKEKKDILRRCEEGDIDILIGTHALIQDDVHFKKLGYVVADEQQRFGVEQRKALRLKGENTDFLLMSATPIPRTLAASLFSDMKVSTDRKSVV